MNTLRKKFSSHLHKIFIEPRLKKIRVLEGMILFINQHRDELSSKRLLTSEVNDDLNILELSINKQLRFFKENYAHWIN